MESVACYKHVPRSVRAKKKFRHTFWSSKWDLQSWMFKSPEMFSYFANDNLKYVKLGTTILYGPYGMDHTVKTKIQKINDKIMKSELFVSKTPIVFTHNDLHGGNMMVDDFPATGSEPEMDPTTLKFIDFDNAQ
jgi:thiamine kinase-like enzyme